MAVRYCAGGCPRLISVSVIPGGSPVALADPKHWAVNYVECVSCQKSWCDRCHAKLGSDCCPTCQQPFTERYVTNVAPVESAVSAPHIGAMPAPKPRRRWFRQRREPELLRARTVTEAHLFMDLRPCACGETRFDGTSPEINSGTDRIRVYSGTCASCGAKREFSFRLPGQDIKSEESLFGDGTPSTLLDPGEWLWVAERYASGPADKSRLDEAGRRRAFRQVALAAAAMDEVLAFVPAGKSAVPRRAFRTELGREMYAKWPGQFDREMLRVLRNTYRQIAFELGG